MNAMIWLASSSTGMETMKESTKVFQVFPQPATNYINVNSSGTIDENAEWTLYSVNGSAIWKSTNNRGTTFQIPTEGMSNGLYSLVCKQRNSIDAAHVLILH
jgi:hypothetical protein